MNPNRCVPTHAPNAKPAISIAYSKLVKRAGPVA